MSSVLAQKHAPSDDPSELVIPAVKGEFYNYSAAFTDTHPLYVFMKCKAQKSRMLSLASTLGGECNLVFQFDSHPRIFTINAANDAGMLGEHVNATTFIETWLARADITTEAFNSIRSTKDEAALVNACLRAYSTKEGSIELQPGVVYAAMTNTGKYCLFLVNELMPTSAEVDACHILI